MERVQLPALLCTKGPGLIAVQECIQSYITFEARENSSRSKAFRGNSFGGYGCFEKSMMGWICDSVTRYTGVGPMNSLGISSFALCLLPACLRHVPVRDRANCKGGISVLWIRSVFQKYS